MERFSLLLTTFLMLATTALKAQDSSNVYGFNFHKLKPTVQIFVTAKYHLENNTCGYSFGHAHLGFQYQFNDKWSAKIIIHRGRATSVGEITVIDTNGNILTVQYRHHKQYQSCKLWVNRWYRLFPRCSVWNFTDFDIRSNVRIYI